MKTYSLKTLDGGTTSLPQEELAQLATNMRGTVLTPESEDYNLVRIIWNGMIDRHPGLIVRCQGASDVIQAVNLARRHHLLVTMRGCGHNIAGNAICEGGMMIDLSLMRSVHVDPVRHIARVEPGCTLADFDHEAQAFGLATPVGINSTTGIAGLTLGGGFGWLSRKYGLTVDNLISADVVTADGRLLQASEHKNEDLFWAIRGGGGNFGVITSFEFEVHPVGPEVLAGLVVHPFEDAREVLQFYRGFAGKLPNEATTWAVLRKAPPLPFLAEEWHGKEVLILLAFYAGEIQEGLQVLQPLREFGHPLADVVGPQPYVQWQKTFDPLLAPGARNYWKSHNFTALSDELIDTLLAFTSNLPTPFCEVFVGQVGGAIAEVPADETAYSQRDAVFIMNVHARWEDSADDDAAVAWARKLFKEAGAYATGGVYINFMTQDETDRVKAAYGPNYDRLVAAKDKYDPENLFRFNQNIVPSVVA